MTDTNPNQDDLPNGEGIVIDVPEGEEDTEPEAEYFDMPELEELPGQGQPRNEEDPVEDQTRDEPNEFTEQLRRMEREFDTAYENTMGFAGVRSRSRLILDPDDTLNTTFGESRIESRQNQVPSQKPMQSRRQTLLTDKTPVRRGPDALTTSAIRTSYCIKNPKSTDDTEELEAMKLRTLGDSLVISGRPLTLRSSPRTEDDCNAIRRWDKTKRFLLTAEARIKYEEAATGYNLPKNGKLAIPSGMITETDDKLVFHVERLQDQIKSLKKHMQTYDIDDVMVIVVPVDVRTSSQLEPTAYDIFRDYSKLHPEVVANSCTWYNRWVDEEYVRENMALTYEFLHKNTEPSLWNKCVELYDEYLPIQQGGPLMLCLLLHRIQNYSEQALTVLVTQISHLSWTHTSIVIS